MYIGDLGTWNEKEYVTIVGRKDDMFISGGENIYPVEVEAVLNEHPAVASSLVIGIPEPKWGNVVAAYIINRSGETISSQELNEYCVQHPMLANYKRSRFYRFVEQLPMTATGKLIHYRPDSRPRRI